MNRELRMPAAVFRAPLRVRTLHVNHFYKTHLCSWHSVKCEDWFLKTNPFIASPWHLPQSRSGQIAAEMFAVCAFSPQISAWKHGLDASRFGKSDFSDSRVQRDWLMWETWGAVWAAPAAVELLAEVEAGVGAVKQSPCWLCTYKPKAQHHTS